MSKLQYRSRRVADPESFLSLFEDVSSGHMNSDGYMQHEARCPAHETNHRSLAIAISRDGMYLIHCHAGCSAESILGAVGLSLSDLYPDGGLFERGRKPSQKGQKARQNDNVLYLARQTRESGGRLSEADKARERRAWIEARRYGLPR